MTTRRINTIWLLLVLATVLTWWLGESGAAVRSELLSAAIVLGLAFAVWAIASGDPEMLKVQGWLFLVSLPIYALIWWAARPKAPAAAT